MKVPFLDLKRQQSSILGELQNVFNSTINEGWYIGGDPVKKFEYDFADYLGIKHCVSCGNGTDALELILRGYQIGPGDEVIIPSFTWVSDAEAVHSVGATPVFADIDPHGVTLSAATIEPWITPKTKAIIVVHLYGIPCEVEAIKLLAGKHNIKVIEDCAQAHGAMGKSKKIGTIGDAGAFSFYPTKNLGALGDGGGVVTNDPELAKVVHLLKDHGQEKRDKHLLIGRNSRLDTLQAAFLSLKLKYLDDWNIERKRLAQIYIDELSGLDLKLPSNHQGRVYHLFVIQTSRRDRLRQHLAEKDIDTAIHFPCPIHLLKPYISQVRLPNSEKAADEVLSLPLFTGLTDAELSYTIDNIKKFFL